MFLRFAMFILDQIARLLGWAMRKRRSRTGDANPRVRHLTGMGYSLRLYELLTPNIRLWWRGEQALFPRVVQVQTVNRCNAACKMCPYPYTVRLEPYQVMSDELWQKIAPSCAREPELQVLVPMSKNEPLLDKKLEERVAFFRQYAQPHHEVEVVTNGSHLDGKRLEQLADSGVDLMTLSVNATTAEGYQETMGGLKWERLQANIRSIMQTNRSRINLFVRLVRQRGNEEEAQAFRQVWQEAGFNALMFDVNNRAGTVKGYESLPPRESTMGDKLLHLARRPLSKVIFPVCPYAFSVAHVLVNGDVPLCANDWQNRELLGNVKEQPLREIFNSPRIKEIRELMREERYEQIAPCRDCSLWKEWTSSYPKRSSNQGSP